MAVTQPALAAAVHGAGVRRVLVAAAILGALLGLETFVLHLLTDPLADVHAYVDAGARLNAAQPLYVQSATTDDAAFYRYPPLLAIVFRPLAQLPFGVAATIWEVLLIGLLTLTVWRLGSNGRTWAVLGMLALPTAWSLVIGQAQIAVTLLMAIGSPWALAFATNLKILPALAALWWVGRREWGQLGRFVAWLVVFAAVQLVLEPSATMDFPRSLTFAQVGDVANLSIYAVSPMLWGIAVLAGIAVVLRLAPTRWGWGAAVALSVLASPRLLVYQLSTLVAAARDPREPREPRETSS